MEIRVESTAAARTATELLALPLFPAGDATWRLSPRLAALDRAVGGRLSAALATGDFKGKRGETLLVYPDAASAARRIVLIGLGPEAELDGETLRRAIGQAVSAAEARRADRLAFVVPTLRRLRPGAAAQALAEGAVLAAYRFDLYRSKRENGAARLAGATLLFERPADARAARSGAEVGTIIAECQNLARDLSNEPANALPPAALARAAERVAKETGLAVRVLDVAEMKKLRMGAILAVGQGSRNPPRLVVLEHNAPKRGAARSRRLPTLCFVGKGITFDSGGISIKPAAAMHEMKHDMSGGAAVIGALRAAALLRIPLHVVGIVAAAENLPGGEAYRPGDVVTAMSGTTIEVLNTDAEGRLVLADALHYAKTNFSPAAMVDLATLTGACIVALGKWSAGLFSNDERLTERVRHAADVAGERVWPLPLWDEHREHIRGDVADLKNTGGRDGGALTAAAFLQHFADGTPWVHLDIAGTAFTDKTSPFQPKGATGAGVRLLVQLMREWRDARTV